MSQYHTMNAYSWHGARHIQEVTFLLGAMQKYEMKRRRWLTSGPGVSPTGRVQAISAVLKQIVQPGPLAQISTAHHACKGLRFQRVEATPQST